MFKLVKYEFRKNLYSILVFMGILLGLEVYFLANYFMKNEDGVVIGATLLYLASMVCFFMVFAFGIVTYSKELSSKSSYLVFMTPNSALKIVASKYVYTFIFGTLIVLVLLGLGIMDINLMFTMFDEEVEFLELVIEWMDDMGISIAEMATELLAGVVEFLVLFFMIISMAYFAITLSATALQNKKGKGIISVLLFVGIFWLAVQIEGFIPSLNENAEGFVELLIAELPCLIYYLLIVFGGMFGCAKLLEKKVSL